MMQASLKDSLKDHWITFKDHFHSSFKEHFQSHLSKSLEVAVALRSRTLNFACIKITLPSLWSHFNNWITCFRLSHIRAPYNLYLDKNKKIALILKYLRCSKVDLFLPDEEGLLHLEYKLLFGTWVLLSLKTRDISFI
jgi:hypothetical protein